MSQVHRLVHHSEAIHLVKQSPTICKAVIEKSVRPIISLYRIFALA